MMPSPRVSPAECPLCASARRHGRVMCDTHWARFEEWMHRNDRRTEWNVAYSRSDNQAMYALMVEWRRWEHEQDKDLRPQCPRCGAEPFARGCCSTCGHGARYGPVKRKR